MFAVLFILMVGLIFFLGYDGLIYFMGWIGGYVLLVLLFVLYLWKFGKYIVFDFVGDCYYLNVVCIVVVIVVIFVLMIYVVG